MKRTGRPSKGPRAVTYTRLNPELRALNEDEAQKLGVTLSDLIAHKVATAQGRPDLSPLKSLDLKGAQEVLLAS